MYLGGTSLANMRLSLYLITALMHSDISYVHTHTQHPRPPAKTSQNLLIPTAMSITHVSPTLQVCKVNIRDEQDRLSVEVHEGLEDGDVSTFVWGQHGHFDIRNCGNKDWDWGYWRLWWGPTSSKRYIHCWTRVFCSQSQSKKLLWQTELELWLPPSQLKTCALRVCFSEQSKLSPPLQLSSSTLFRC